MKSVARLALLSGCAALVSAANITLPGCGNPANAVPFYRSFNAADVDHWYTPDVGQINYFNPVGFALQGVTGRVFLTQESGTTPFYRLYNYALMDNFYTISPSEKAAAESNGYVTDATSSPVSYIYPTQVCGSIPLYRLYHSSKHDNFYTTSDVERSQAVANDGYDFVEIAGYILPLGCAAPA
ncbi:hypothetical protein MSAN_00472600 [Mycena sanguinolenta]|uniref:DUF5648 domain-containing protein n=1 Tax=Mycena sanguinolenta TaxID=230812 RepID=A0A8H6ZDS6_9AGAR|nr:hypothetical protein MSAN_00472600 [Mycena sanguinolenta]